MTPPCAWFNPLFSVDVHACPQVHTVYAWATPTFCGTPGLPPIGLCRIFLQNTLLNENRELTETTSYKGFLQL